MNQDTTKIENEVRAAIESDPASIAERVRGVTLAALSEGTLDTAALKQVMSAVLKGAQQGIDRPDGQSAAAIGEAVRGLDEALAAAAQATQFAIQEAAGRAGEFSRQGLKSRLDELGSVESLFIETLTDAARSATGHAQAALRDLAAHSRASGTAVGGRVEAAATQLARAVAGMAQEQVAAGTRTLRNEAGLLAGLAAGMLRGIADRLQSLSGDQPASGSGSESPPPDRSA
jgi:hypothetical protein